MTTHKLAATMRYWATAALLSVSEDTPDDRKWSQINAAILTVGDLRLLSAAPNAGEDEAAKCEICGGPAFVWFAPNDLWNLVKGGPDAKDDPGGMLCPNCFIRASEKKGIVPTAWVLSQEDLAIVPQRDAMIEALRDALTMVAKYELSSPEEFREIARSALKSHPAPPAQDERGMIVKWLHDDDAMEDLASRANAVQPGGLRMILADAIERGDHLPAKAEG